MTDAAPARSLAQRRLSFGAAVAGFWALVFGVAWWAGHFIALPGDNDFHNYVVAATVGLNHGWDRIYDATLQRQAWTSFTAGMGSLPFIYRTFASPPVVAWLAVPFAFLPIPVGYVIWSALTAAALVLTWRLLAPGTAGARFAQLGLALVLAPVAWDLRLGGDVTFVAAAVVGSYWLLGRRREVLAGVVLAGISLKPTVAFLVPVVLLAAGHRRAFAAWAGVTAALAILAVATLGPQGVASYLALLRQEDSLRFNTYLSWAQIAGPGGPQLAASAAIVVAGLVVTWRRRRTLEAAYAAALTASVLASPYLHAQDFTVLLPAAWFAWRALDSPWRWSLLLLIPAAEVVFIFGSLPLLVGGVLLLGLLGLSQGFPEPTRGSLAASRFSGIARS